MVLLKADFGTFWENMKEIKQKWDTIFIRLYPVCYPFSTSLCLNLLNQCNYFYLLSNHIVNFISSNIRNKNRKVKRKAENKLFSFVFLFQLTDSLFKSSYFFFLLGKQTLVKFGDFIKGINSRRTFKIAFLSFIMVTYT